LRKEGFLSSVLSQRFENRRSDVDIPAVSIPETEIGEELINITNLREVRYRYTGRREAMLNRLIIWRYQAKSNIAILKRPIVYALFTLG